MRLTIALHAAHPQFTFPFDSYSEDYPHPFHILEELEKDIDNYKKEDFFSKTYSFHLDIQSEMQKALLHFQFEANLCIKRFKGDYLQAVTKQLLNIYIRVQQKNHFRNKHTDLNYIEVQINKNYFPLYLFLLDALEVCFEFIMKKYDTELSKELTKEISKILYPQEPLLSFQLSRDISDKDLEDSFTRRLIDKKLIHPKTEFSTFKNLFSNKPLEEKIEWTSTLSALYYFISQLVKKDMKGQSAVVNPNNKHWKITSEFFTYNGEKSIPNLKYQKSPKQDSKKPIEQFIRDLKSL